MGTGPSPAAAFDAALLVLRIGIAWVFLFAAWRNSENKAAWNWTRGETALLFRALPVARSQRITPLAALAGLAMMYGGGLSVLLGLAPRPGAFALVVFSAIGMRINAIRREEAKAAGQAGDAMGWSAYGAHLAAGLKNWALIAAGIAIILIGAGRYAIGVDIGAPLVGRFFG